MPSVLRIKNPDGTWYEVTALKGDTGITPNLQIGTVTTGNPGTSAEVTITGTPEEPVLNFKIPKGEPGTGGGGSANIDDTTPSTSTTYSSSKIESKLTALNDANAALIEVSKTEPNTENTELWIHPNANEVQLPQINDSVESEQDTWSSKKIAAEVSNKANEKDLAAVAKSGSYNDLTNKPTIPTVPSTLPNPNALTFTGAVNETYDGSAAKSVAIPTVPTTLPNPNKLTFTGAVTAEYDGSAPVSVEIPAGGGPAYELPVATPTTLGGVKAAAKTETMTQAVGVDEAGGLWTQPGGGGGNWITVGDVTLTEETSEIKFDWRNSTYPFNVGRIYVLTAYLVGAAGAESELDVKQTGIWPDLGGDMGWLFGNNLYKVPTNGNTRHVVETVIAYEDMASGGQAIRFVNGVQSLSSKFDKSRCQGVKFTVSGNFGVGTKYKLMFKDL